MKKTIQFPLFSLSLWNHSLVFSKETAVWGWGMSGLYCTCSLICLCYCLIAGSSQVNRLMAVSHPLLSQRTPYMGTKLIEGHSLWGFVLSKIFKFFHYLMLFTHHKWASISHANMNRAPDSELVDLFWPVKSHRHHQGISIA